MAYDVIVIGGGPAGLMAAVAAAEQDATVFLIEKGRKLGRKLAISGGGRCNVTNRKPVDELIQYLPGNGKFLYSPLAHFNNADIIRFFENLGIPVKEEDKGRMFPVSDSAKSVVAALVHQIETLQVDIRMVTSVQTVLYAGGAVQGVRLSSNEEIFASNVIVAVGGKAVPNTGSTGDGYAWAQKAGHSITALYPTEVPLTSAAPFIKRKTLQGVSLRDVAVSVHKPNGKTITTHRWDMIFTHQGLSGPAVLRCSQYVVKALAKYKTDDIVLTIDSLPDQTEEGVIQQLLQHAKQEPNKAVKNVWKGMVPESYMLFLCEHVGLSAEITYHHLRKEGVRALAHALKSFPVAVNGTLSLAKAFITGGGVALKELNPKTMASKKMSGLYFCGEILDIHGFTGGYNITAAFATGHTAGSHAATRIDEG